MPDTLDMAAYVDLSAQEFVGASHDHLVAELQRAYAADRFITQYVSQSIAWEQSLPLLQQALANAIRQVPTASDWRVLLELPLYRLRRRIDALVVTDHAVVVLELKVGATTFLSQDGRQVEEYALDLRDFHEHSASLPLVPALWCTEAESHFQYPVVPQSGVAKVQLVGRGDVAPLLVAVHKLTQGRNGMVKERWSSGAYRPVPTVIEAATTLFAGHGVEEITRADASNLRESAERIVSIIAEARAQNRRALIFLTGVPGSGKTLAGLQVVHRAVARDVEEAGDIVYLSGNTPLVTVIREALARDEYARKKATGDPVAIGDVRRAVRARIQHIIDYLRQYLAAELGEPVEHSIVFDEAQRAWDERYGKQKFGRTASEPRLLLEIIGRHRDWCALVGLVGGGQEINTGENGIAEWGDALRGLPAEVQSQWTVNGPATVIEGDRSTAFLGLGELPPEIDVVTDEALKLEVTLRSYRSPRLAEWVEAVIDGDSGRAAEIAGDIGNYPIALTRDVEEARAWLTRQGRGERRYGLVASSGAGRLRAEGLGVSLNATDGQKIAHWYLNPRDDVRSSYALEVTANEYTTQGLELDFVGVCWDGDFTYADGGWKTRQFRGSKWVQAKGDRRRFISNSYRVLLTRAREGMVLWVPRGRKEDPTRDPKTFDRTAAFLRECGAGELPTKDGDGPS
jgi:hypothetical protein